MIEFHCHAQHWRRISFPNSSINALPLISFLPNLSLTEIASGWMSVGMTKGSGINKVLMPLDDLDCSKIPGIFGLEVCILVKRLSFSIHGMKVLGTGKDMRENLKCSLLVMCIVTEAKDSSGTLWANYLAGIDFSCRRTICPKVATCCYN